MRKNSFLLVLCVTVKFIIQIFAINSYYELQRDEYLHLDLGKHLAWGYLSVPPVTGTLSWIINSLGSSVFWIKFFPAVFGSLIIILVWKAVEALGGGLFACLLSAVANIFSVMLRINTLYQPNSLDYLCWTLLFFTLLKFFASGSRNDRWLYYSALAFALGFLNKYNICFLAAGLVPALLLSEQRKIFLNKHLYLASLLALILVFPNIVWQIKNGFPVIHHMKQLASSQLVNVSRFDFLKDQLLFFIGSIFILIAGFIAFFTYLPFKKYRVFFYTLIFTLALFVYLRAKNYYAIGVYPIFLAFGATYLEFLLRKRWLKYLRIALVIVPILLFILTAKFLLPILSPLQIENDRQVFDKLGLTRWEDGKLHDIPQDFADMTGWKEMAHLVDSAYKLSPDKSTTLVQCDNYGEAGAVNFYSAFSSINARSMNADYLYWYDLSKPIEHVILVKENEKHLADAQQAFANWRLIGEITNPYARERGTKVFLLENAKVSVNDILRKEIAEEFREIRR